MTEFKRRLHNGALLVAPMITMASPVVTELLSGSGYDWFFIDAEHGTFSTEDIQNVVRGAGDTPCLVRLASSDSLSVKKALDVGAAGIIAPMVNSVETAEEIVSAAKYSPEGTRGVGLGRAQRYGFGFNEYLETSNDNVIVILQAEHIDAVDNIDSIAKVTGVDGVLLGPYDLSASMGLIGQIDHPSVQNAIARVEASCKANNKSLGIFGVSADAVRPFIERGFNLIVAGVDTVMLGHEAARMVKEIQSFPRPT